LFECFIFGSTFGMDSFGVFVIDFVARLISDFTHGVWHIYSNDKKSNKKWVNIVEGSNVC